MKVSDLFRRINEDGNKEMTPAELYKMFCDMKLSITEL